MKDILYFVLQVLIVVAVIIVTYCIYTFIRLRMEYILKASRSRRLTLSELEQRVYRYEPEYFKLIGEGRDPVIEFRKVIERKDISTLYNKWGSFRKSFLALETNTGGRPMLVDYYDDYEMDVRELYERKKAEL